MTLEMAVLLLAVAVAGIVLVYPWQSPANRLTAPASRFGIPGGYFLSSASAVFMSI